MFEAALVLPLLLFLIFGVFEVGGVLSSYSTTANSVRAGGRMASVAGSDAMADQMVLARIAQESAALGDGEIRFIVLWHATGPDDTVPAACVAAAGSASTPNGASVGVSDAGTDAVGACNVYIQPGAGSNAAFAMAQGDATNPSEYYFGCTGPSDPDATHKLDCRWPPQHRRTTISPRVLPAGTPESARLRPDYLGVYMAVEHTYLSGILGPTQSITDSSINLLEPSTFGVGS